MKKEIVILGSTGSVGTSTLNIVKKNNEFKIKLITTNKNAKKILHQAIYNKIKDVIIEDYNVYKNYKSKFKKNKINLHFGIKNINKILNKQVTYCVNSISGIDGLEPTLKMIPLCKNILISNKESLICGWSLIKKKLLKHNTNFIPIDSEHFSIWKLIKSEKHNEISSVYLTASGGPFLNRSLKTLSNVEPEIALKHPNWKMGKKISIDSSTLMNKIFEYIEAKKIFNLKKKNISIIIHPSSFVHAIVFFKGDIIKILAHNTNMSIPISNALGIRNKLKKKFISSSFNKLNSLKFISPKKKQFPVLSIIDLIPEKETYFETILITINDTLVKMYLDRQINYLSIQQNLLNLIKKPYFKKFYKLKPKNIYDIKKTIMITKKYLKDNLIKNEI